MLAIDLSGRTAIVTGSGRGIGLAIASQLSAAGANVVVNDLDAEVAQEAGASLGANAFAVSGDVTAPEFPQRLVDASLERFGGIDIIVNNAGYTWDSVI